MNLWLTRRPNGLYLLTRLRPVIVRRDVYMTPGEPIGVNYLCPWGVRALTGRSLRPLRPVRVRLTMRVEE